MTAPNIEQIIAAVENCGEGSSAPAIVGLIYMMPDLSLSAKRALAKMFLSTYFAMVELE